jgi:hypothetical protein
LGVPQWVPVSLSHGPDSWSWDAIKVEHLDPQTTQRYLGSSVEVNLDDLFAHIPRTVPETPAADGRYSIDGKTYEVLYVDRSRAVTWGVLLRAFRRR